MSPAALKHPGRWLWLLVAIPVIIGFARIRLDTEVLNLLPQELPAVQGLKAYQDHFTSARELIVLFRHSDADALEQYVTEVGKALRGSPSLVESAAWQPPWTEHPDQVPAFLAWLWLNQPPEVFAQLEARLRSPDAQFALAKSRLSTSLSPHEIANSSYDPMGIGGIDNNSGDSQLLGGGQDMFASPDGTFRLMFVQAKESLSSYQDCERWIGEVRAVIDTVPWVRSSAAAEGEVNVRFTGSPAFVAEIGRGMHEDIRNSVLGTAVVIALLFWLAHRRLKPLIWLLTLLGLILVGTLGLGGLMFGTLNIISAGFAAILLGLAVDYALLHYHEARANPELSVPQVRRVIAPGIAWAAITTIAAFLWLNLGGLPGLAQLGTVVAMGVALGALVMVFEFLPPLFPHRKDSGEPLVGGSPDEPSGRIERANGRSGITYVALAGTFALLLLLAVALFTGLPVLDASSDALRPAHSPAFSAMADVQKHFTKAGEPLWVLFSAKSESDLRSKANELQSWADEAKRRDEIKAMHLPLTLLPDERNRKANLPRAEALSALTNSLVEASVANGFEPGAVQLAQGVLQWWGRAAREGRVAQPANELSHWALDKVIARTATNLYAIAIIEPVREGQPTLLADPPESVWLTSWSFLGSSVLRHVQGRLWIIVIPMAGLVVFSLMLAFRNIIEVFLSVASIALAGLCLLGLMKLFGWSWNLMNLMAIPLILGTGVDYGIFVQLALRRNKGHVREVWRTTGQALLLCAATGVAGFGSLGFSSNAGVAGLGRVCAAGIACNVAVALVFLPFWWLWSGTGRRTAAMSPSSLYNPKLWRAGLWIARILPLPVLRGLGVVAAALYGTLARTRREIVVSNLAPALGGDRTLAKAKAGTLFRRFGAKMADLLRYESGVPMEHLLGDAFGYDDNLQPVRRAKRGALLLTAHLGNWELGGPWLVRRGIDLWVITQQEPGEGFTEMREAARKRLNIHTVVVGNDSFAFLEVIRLLDAGELVALLIDRPPPPTGVPVKLFGRPFCASIAAAELARATGCALLPSYIVWANGRYEAHMLPEVPYDRASLRQRENRERLTQEIMTRFEPVIERHIDQWFHFVPIWK